VTNNYKNCEFRWSC